MNFSSKSCFVFGVACIFAAASITAGIVIRTVSPPYMASQLFLASCMLSEPQLFFCPDVPFLSAAVVGHCCCYAIVGILVVHGVPTVVGVRVVGVPSVVDLPDAADLPAVLIGYMGARGGGAPCRTSSTCLDK